MRFSKEPHMAWLTINRACQMRCQWCYAQGTQYHERDTMSLEDVDFALNIIKKFSINKVALIGGEPLIHPEIYNILNLCQIQQIAPTVITNGLLLSNNDCLSELVKCGLKNFNLSIKAPSREDYKKNVGLDCYDQILKAIHNIVDKHLNLTISYVVTNDNVGSLATLFSSLNKLGVKSFYISFCNPYFTRENVQNYGVKIFDLIEKFILQCDQLLEERIRFNFHLTLPMCFFPQSFLSKLKLHGALSTSCQLQNRDGLIFDTNLNLIPCNSLYGYPYLFYGKDYNSYESLCKALKSKRITTCFEKLLSAPSKKCVECQNYIYCGGGCLLQWFYYDWNSIEKIKETFYARKTNRTKEE